MWISVIADAERYDVPTVVLAKRQVRPVQADHVALCSRGVTEGSAFRVCRARAFRLTWTVLRGWRRSLVRRSS
jgi:hypothetical protein